MVLPVRRPFSFLAVAAALFAGGYPSLLASALDATVTDCAELAALPTDAMTEDVKVIIRGALTCNEVITVKADGPHKFTLYGGSGQVFTNVRFDVSGGANFVLTSLVRMITSMTFTGVKELESNGGVFNVELGSSAQFRARPTFDQNSVQAGYSGGAVYAGGQVSFPFASTFNENSVMSDDNSPSGSGGALFVEHGGAVVFGDAADFTYNEVGSGGRGGAIANLGSVIFAGPSGQSTFTDNAASAYTSAAGDVTGGHGGAIFTGDSGVTAISGLTSAYHNSAFSGGALYNSGTTLLTSTSDEFTTQFANNYATGGETANGGHIYTSGVVYVQDDCDFTYGSSTGNGGAVYIDDEGSFISEGEVTYASNTADGACNDKYVGGGNPVCQPSDQAIL